MSPPLVVWDPRMLDYDFGGNHPLDPLRWELTWLLAESLGVIDGFEVFRPGPADVETLGLIHTLGYIDAVRRASRPGFPFSVGHGLGGPDNPIFPGMHDAAALIAGGSVAAARAIAHSEVDRAVNFCGGLHHAMPDSASGFGVYNDAALSIAAMLQSGVRKIAYVDVDAHHADGVQAAFYDDPRVLTISVHQSPLSLFPGTGYPTECGEGAAEGMSVNIAVPAGTTDALWLRAFHAVVPGVVRAFRPDVLVTQHGADSHREDPLADLNLSIDGQRTSYVALRELAESVMSDGTPHPVGLPAMGRRGRSARRPLHPGHPQLDLPAARVGRLRSARLVADARTPRRPDGHRGAGSTALVHHWRTRTGDHFT